MLSGGVQQVRLVLRAMALCSLGKSLSGSAHRRRCCSTRSRGREPPNCWRNSQKQRIIAMVWCDAPKVVPAGPCARLPGSREVKTGHSRG